MSKKLYDLRLAVKSPHEDFKIIFIENIVADDLVELCARIPLLITRGENKLKECKATFIDDDDIPF